MKCDKVWAFVYLKPLFNWIYRTITVYSAIYIVIAIYNYICLVTTYCPPSHPGFFSYSGWFDLLWGWRWRGWNDDGAICSFLTGATKLIIKITCVGVSWCERPFTVVSNWFLSYMCLYSQNQEQSSVRSCSLSCSLSSLCQSRTAGPCWHAASGTFKNGNTESVCSGTFDGQHLSPWYDRGHSLSVCRVCLCKCEPTYMFVRPYFSNFLQKCAYSASGVIDVFFYLFMGWNHSATLGGLDDHIHIAGIRWQPHTSRVSSPAAKISFCLT